MNGHLSVLLPETIALLKPREGGVYLDLTLGRGGTSEAILKRIGTGRLYAFDLDEEALSASRPRLEAISPSFVLIHDDYRNFASHLKESGVKGVDGIVADLGVSSPQFDDSRRGFSYRFDAPLDMRMDRFAPLSAKDIVNSYAEEELIRVFKEYGEDPDAKRVARAIVRKRATSPIETTGELVEIIKEAKPFAHKAGKGHPAKQIFQALRIETNGELDSLKSLLGGFDEVLAPGGVIAIITFHSLEDRLVKERFRSLTRVKGDRANLPIRPEEARVAPYEDLTKKPVSPSEREIQDNPRSHSAHLRAIRKKGGTNDERQTRKKRT